MTEEETRTLYDGIDYIMLHVKDAIDYIMLPVKDASVEQELKDIKL